MKIIKKILLAALLLAVLTLTVCYFFAYSCSIGHPESVTLRYWDGETKQYLEKALTAEEREQFCSLLRNTTLTIILHPDQINAGFSNEDTRIKLSYADGSQKLFTTWCGNAILYEGSGETMNYEEMRGALFHFAGSTDTSLTQLISQIMKGK